MHIDRGHPRNGGAGGNWRRPGPPHHHTHPNQHNVFRPGPPPNKQSNSPHNDDNALNGDVVTAVANAVDGVENQNADAQRDVSKSGESTA